jgi:hypothetical protein
MSYNLELVPARLMPFDWNNGVGTPPNTVMPAQNSIIYGYPNDPTGQTMTSDQLALAQASASAIGLTYGYSIQQQSSISINGVQSSGQTIYPSNHPLYPLTLTNGLVFPYNPIISEALGVKYDTVDMTHTNEAVNAYKHTDNVRISLSECVWTAETFDQAIYLLGVIHFFRSYSLMDFGRGTSSTGRKPSGRPPSPMWFWAYGNFMYEQVPVLIERVEFSFPNDIDYVGVPNPGTSNYDDQVLQYSNSLSFDSFLSQSGEYTWVPMKFTIGSIAMIVQHSVSYWTQTFNLDDFKAGLLVGRS